MSIMSNIKVITISIFLLISQIINCNDTNIDEVISILYESELMNNPDEFFDYLNDLHENPIDINSANREILSQIPFLTDELIENISYYMYRYGPMVDINEVKLINGIDETIFKLLTPFIYINESKTKNNTVKTPLKDLFKYPKNEIRLSVNQNFSGYNKTDSFVGNSLTETLRYGLKYKDKIQSGFVIQKDAGENFISSNKMPDYWSINLLINDIGFVKRIVFGDFNVNFGQGLVCGKSFTLGKNLSLSNVEVYSQEISRHYSSSETGFYRGTGINLYMNKTKSIEFTGFGSIKKIDTNLSDNSFSSIIETGLHRNDSEINRKENAKYFSCGSRLSINKNIFQIGINSILWRFSHFFNPKEEPYNFYNFRGKNGFNASLDYRIRIEKITIFGETAICRGKSVATLTGLNIKPYSLLDMSFLYRDYSPSYYSFSSGGFSEGGNISNEKGLYFVARYNLIKNITLNLYIDLYKYPWLKYNKDFISNGNDIAIQITYLNNRNTNVGLRYKKKVEYFSSIFEQCKRQIRVNISNKKINPSFQTSLDANSFTANNTTNFGLGLTQTIEYNDIKNRLNLYFKTTLFDAVNYENRLFVYEKSLPGTFAMPSLYGSGIRSSFSANYNLNKTVSLWFKIGRVTYLKKYRIEDKKTDTAMTLRLKI